ncbi:GNAT family N-acetyltransferase [Pontibacillus sp. HN14]|uniref:GNAT family N-acetyltransferase n=1 Tax=Pontibacillus sp. HN14 TaxID=2898421 RepID=UPI001E541629|nr:GNAT family N-acetyltransferase [Pontibacillus sp. HN14]
MYRKVTNVEYNSQFNELWRQTCEEGGAKYLDKQDDATRYIITHRKEIVGTIEFLPRNPEKHSLVEGYFDFVNNELVPCEKEGVFEIGKFTVKKGYRGRGISEDLLLIVADHAREYNVKWYFAALNEKLYKRFTERFNLELIQVGSSISISSGVIVPVIYNVGEVLQNSKKLNWYISLIKAKKILLKNQ